MEIVQKGFQGQPTLLIARLAFGTCYIFLICVDIGPYKWKFGSKGFKANPDYLMDLQSEPPETPQDEAGTVLLRAGFDLIQVGGGTLRGRTLGFRV